MDAISKELVAWNLTLPMEPVTHINLKLRKFFCALELMIKHVICKSNCKNKDKTDRLFI